MERICTFREAKAAGYTHIWAMCDTCHRAKSIMLDVLERQAGRRTLDDLRGVFRCQRCGSAAGKICLSEQPQRIKEFDFIVAIWDDRRLDIDKVELAACHFKDAEPAFHAIAGRNPRRWVTLLSPTGIVLDSDRDVVGVDV
jgi:hypothetical protein